MRLAALDKFKLLAFLLAGCGGGVVLAKDDPPVEAGAMGAGGDIGAAGGATGTAGQSSHPELGGGGSTAAGSSGGASPTMDAALIPQPEVPDTGTANRHFKVLVFTRAMEFFHDSISTGVAMLKAQAVQTDEFDVVDSMDSGVFNDASLAQYAVVVFLNTTGGVLTMDVGGPAEKAALQNYMDHGGGFVGIHAAADTEKGWPWYVDLLGASMDSHDADGTPGVVLIDQTVRHPATLGLPASWARNDEWYYSRAPCLRASRSWRVSTSRCIALCRGSTSSRVADGCSTPSRGTTKPVTPSLSSRSTSSAASSGRLIVKTKSNRLPSKHRANHRLETVRDLRFATIPKSSRSEQTPDDRIVPHRWAPRATPDEHLGPRPDGSGCQPSRGRSHRGKRLPRVSRRVVRTTRTIPAPEVVASPNDELRPVHTHV